MKVPARAILIFSKSAEAGKVKTRLRALLSDSQCLSLHLALLADTIAKARTQSANVILYLSGATPLPFDPAVPIHSQTGSDLGERLWNAFTEQLEHHGKVLIIGADSPTFLPDIFARAFDLLNTHEIVLGPAEDGGYYLIGLKKMIPEIFRDIAWSTDQVMKQTVAASASRRVAFLPSCFDIDQPTDLDRLRRELRELEFPWMNHTKKWLRSNQFTTKTRS